jgi:hypothetical protein
MRKNSISVILVMGLASSLRPLNDHARYTGISVASQAPVANAYGILLICQLRGARKYVTVNMLMLHLLHTEKKWRNSIRHICVAVVHIPGSGGL